MSIESYVVQVAQLHRDEHGTVTLHVTGGPLSLTVAAVPAQAVPAPTPAPVPPPVPSYGQQSPPILVPHALLQAICGHLQNTPQSGLGDGREALVDPDWSAEQCRLFHAVRTLLGGRF